MDLTILPALSMPMPGDSAWVVGCSASTTSPNISRRKHESPRPFVSRRSAKRSPKVGPSFAAPCAWFSEAMLGHRYALRGFGYPRAFRPGSRPSPTKPACSLTSNLPPIAKPIAMIESINHGDIGSSFMALGVYIDSLCIAIQRGARLMYRAETHRR